MNHRLKQSCQHPHPVTDDSRNQANNAQVEKWLHILHPRPHAGVYVHVVRFHTPRCVDCYQVQEDGRFQQPVFLQMAWNFQMTMA